MALAKGSISVALTVAALESVGLKWEDVEPAFLLPADAKAAFNGGSVDAWTIWDPYYALEEGESGARTIATNESAGLPQPGVLPGGPGLRHGERGCAGSHHRVPARGAETWVDEHTDEVVEILSTETGLAPRRSPRGRERRVHGLEPVTTEEWWRAAATRRPVLLSGAYPDQGRCRRRDAAGVGYVRGVDGRNPHPKPLPRPAAREVGEGLSVGSGGKNAKNMPTLPSRARWQCCLGY